MLNFFESAGDVLTAFGILFLGLIGILTLARRIGLPQTRAALIYVWHILLSVAFTQFTLAGGVDSATYFELALHGPVSFQIGTKAVSFIGSVPVRALHLSYLGTNFLYAAIACCGLLLIDQSIRIVASSKGPVVQLFASSFIFLPSMHFWTASISKDSLMMLASGFMIWFSMNPNRRVPLAIVGLILMLLMRPHMALVFLVSFLLANILTGRLSPGKKIAVSIASTAVIIVLLPLLLQRFDIGSNIGQLSSYIEDRQISGASIGGSSIDLQSMSLPAQLFSFVFRPTLLDGGGILGLMAGLENLLMLIATSAIVVQARSLIGGASLLPGRATLICYGVIGWWLLASTTYNLGLASRQKWMIVPVLVIILISLAKNAPRKRYQTWTQPNFYETQRLHAKQ
jgi:hypothetical protein